MRINITAGECLNEILSNKFANELFVPFNEAMIKGEYHHKLFSEEFMIERSNTHQVSIDEYKTKLKPFLELLNNLDKYNEIILFFGDEPFCNANKKIVLKTLTEREYVGKIILNTVDEVTGDILKTEVIQ